MYLWKETSNDGGRMIAVPNAMELVMKPAQEWLVQPLNPLIRITTDEAQQMMDSLWDCGLRPSEGSGSAGSLAATQRHLDDMRTLVFGKPKEKK